jgi:Zn ribbon nucleic-acid-binding protein
MAKFIRRCYCARCQGLPTADPIYGFDRAKVAGVECLKCGRKIGRAKYEIVDTLVRLGQVFFVHTRCA